MLRFLKGAITLILIALFALCCNFRVSFAQDPTFIVGDTSLRANETVANVPVSAKDVTGLGISFFEVWVESTGLDELLSPIRTDQGRLGVAFVPHPTMREWKFSSFSKLSADGVPGGRLVVVGNANAASLADGPIGWFEVKFYDSRLVEATLEIAKLNFHNETVRYTDIVGQTTTVLREEKVDMHIELPLSKLGPSVVIDLGQLFAFKVRHFVIDVHNDMGEAMTPLIEEGGLDEHLFPRTSSGVDVQEKTWSFHLYARPTNSYLPRAKESEKLRFSLPSGTFELVFHYQIISWDVNGDRVVDILDLTQVARWFGRTVDPDTREDVNGDRAVDTVDLAIVGYHFGERYEGATAAAPALQIADLVGTIADPTAHAWVEDFLAKRTPSPRGKRLTMWGAQKKR